MNLWRIEIPNCPPSLNQVGGRSHWTSWSKAKKSWQAEVTRQLEYIELPKGQTQLTAGARLRFPKVRRRDSDNHTALLAKATGDALVKGGWLPDDEPQFFFFEPVCFDPAPGPELTVMLFCEGVQPSLFDGAWDLPHAA